jgi:hypothetical protein
MAQLFSLSEQGFITKWLVSGPVDTPFSADERKGDQLAFERYMRSLVTDDRMTSPPAEIVLGKPGCCGRPWRYYAGGGDWFVDASSFYATPRKIELYACTTIVSDAARKVEVVLWTYAAIDAWLGERKIGRVGPPAYKPIMRLELELDLLPGDNQLFLRMQNLGVRDTRSIVGLELKGDTSGIGIALPGGDGPAGLAAFEDWLGSLRYADGALRLPSPSPVELQVLPIAISIPRGSVGAVPLAVGGAERISISGEAAGQSVRRDIEIVENIRPRIVPPGADAEGSRLAVFERLAAIPSEQREDEVAFSVYHVLARRACGMIAEEDLERLRQDLRHIRNRVDCADFLVVGILRLLLSGGAPDSLKGEIEDALLSFRYWMDEEGSDGMCFWSENHALMFYGAQMVAGSLYPDATFLRSGRLGREQAAIGEERCLLWLDDIEKEGFEEFLSANYTCVTLAALLHLVDFGPGNIPKRAAALIDCLVAQLATQAFKGSAIGPQGRVYRSVIYPFAQDAQALLHYIDPSCPAVDSMWLSTLASSKYSLPAHLGELMARPVEKEYRQGNARIVLKKTADYALSSIACDRPEAAAPAWRNVASDEGVDRSSYAFVKSLNERFHGTTWFRPGVFGYQQHLWCGALDNECVFFTNHPGATRDTSEMRPGYWYGNGIFPAIRQEGSRIGLVYVLPESHPIRFTHLYWPSARFDAVERRGNWLFGRKGDSYAALWCSAPLVAHDDLVCGCEYRAYGRATAYAAICSCAAESGSFGSFIGERSGEEPRFEAESGTLRIGASFVLTFSPGEDTTQYV